MAALSFMQWLFGAVMYFSKFNPGQALEVSKMQLNAEDYFDFAIPATFAFTIGLTAINFSSKQFLILRDNVQSTSSGDRSALLLLIGFLSQILSPFAPLILKLPLYFLSIFGWAGVTRVIFIPEKKRRDVFLAALFVLFIIYKALVSSMFSDLVIGLGLLVLFSFFHFRTTVAKKMVLILSGLLIVTVIQVVKPYLRLMTLKQGVSTSEAISRISDSELVSKDYVQSDRFVSYSISRFNQASIITWVMKHTPRNEPHTHGTTVFNAIAGSFIPRAIWPNKPLSGVAMYLQYTGLDFEGASYGVSQLGEGYINFGKKWTWLFMLALGLFYSGFLKICLNYSRTHPEFFFYLPAIFLHTIKVETDINRSLGFMLRFVVFLFVLNAVMKFFFGKRLY